MILENNILDKTSPHEKDEIALSFIEDLKDDKIYEFIKWIGIWKKEDNYWVRECLVKSFESQNIVSRGIMLRIHDNKLLVALVKHKKS